MHTILSVTISALLLHLHIGTFKMLFWAQSSDEGENVFHDVCWPTHVNHLCSRWWSGLETYVYVLCCIMKTFDFDASVTLTFPSCYYKGTRFPNMLFNMFVMIKCWWTHKPTRKLTDQSNRTVLLMVFITSWWRTFPSLLWGRVESGITSLHQVSRQKQKLYWLWTWYLASSSGAIVVDWTADA